MKDNTVLIGRMDELRALIQTLCRLDKNNPVLVGQAGVGKAQPLTSKIRVKDGWVRMENISVGDKIVSADGTLSEVTGVFPQGKKEVFKVLFADGRVAECCENHLWKVNSEGGWEVLELKDISKRIEAGERLFIPLAQPAESEDVDYFIDCYSFGVLISSCNFLKDERIQFSLAKKNVLETLTKLGVSYSETTNTKGKTIGEAVLSEGQLLSEIRNLNIVGRHYKSVSIPSFYMGGSKQQKIELLRGVLASSATVNAKGIFFYTSSVQFARDVRGIVWSLGGICSVKEKINDLSGAITYSCKISQKELNQFFSSADEIESCDLLEIKKVSENGEKDCQCIQIDHESKLYVTDNYVVTHNTVIVQGLAKMIVRNEVPDNLKNYTIYSLSLNGLIAGSKLRGELEERVDNILREAVENKDKVILFIDEMHMIAQKQGDYDISNVMKPALARGELKCIGATTVDEYSKFIESDKALKRRLNKIYVDEPDVQETITIVRGIKGKFETYYGIEIEDKAIHTAVELAKRYFVDLRCPDVVIDIIDETASRMNFEFSMEPGEVASLNKTISSLKLELESKKIDLVKDSLVSIEVKAINERLAELNEKYTTERGIWNEERKQIDKIRALKKQLADLLAKSDNLMKSGDFTGAGKIIYVDAPEVRGRLKDVEDTFSGKYINITMDKMQVVKTISAKLDIPVSKLVHDYGSLGKMESYLSQKLAAQDKAIKAVCNQFKLVFSGFKQEDRPLSVLFFAGSTGVGKTELAKRISEFMFGDSKSGLVHLNMSKYTEAHTVSNLIGSPAGYIGYGEEGELTGRVRSRPYGVVLLDEIEKAHPAIYDILLPVMDEGKITDRAGRLVSFRETVLIFTSNIGHAHTKTTNDDEAELEKRIKEDLKKNFRREFINRIDEIVVFNKIGKSFFARVGKIHLDKCLETFRKEHSIEIRYEQEVLLHIADCSYDEEFGARDIKRNIQKLILHPVLSELAKYEKENIVSANVRMSEESEQILITVDLKNET